MGRGVYPYNKIIVKNLCFSGYSPIVLCRLVVYDIDYIFWGSNNAFKVHCAPKRHIIIQENGCPQNVR